MNIFVLAWNISTELIPVAMNELRQMVDIYPQLDPNTIWHWNPNGRAFAASMHVSTQAVAPRIYVSRSQDGVTFYDGTVVLPQSNFNAHDAEALSSKWDLLPEIAEGQFVAARVTNQPLSIEVMTDFLGMKQVYYFQQGNMWLISNSVRLIEKITQASSLDPLGVSLFLSMGWVGSDRTLKQDILTIPGGQCWKWELDKVEPLRKAYFTSSQLATSKPKKLTRLDTEELAEQLIALFRNLAENLGELRCPLTGGRDSRLLASFLIHAGIPAKYYTSGVPSSADVQIATQIAETFHLPHEVNTSVFGKDILEKWETASRRLIQQNDGMVSLWQINDVLRQSSHIDKLNISLWGIGGGIARGQNSNASLFLGRHGYGVEDIQKFLTAKLTNNCDGLIQPKATILTKDYLQSFVAKYADEGFAPFDLLDIFHTYDRVRRWAGSNARKEEPNSSLFTPFCTRPFVRAAFAMSAMARYTEPLHYKLTQFLEPELHGFPSDKGPWRSQQPVLNVLNKIWKASLAKIGYSQPTKSVPAPLAFDRAEWLEADGMKLLSKLRELCLDQSDSVIWDFVSRSRFEHITSLDTNLAKLSRKYISTIYNIATLFQYFSI